jgi:ATP-dependent Clp protease ATP-binding subunit ClpA
VRDRLAERQVDFELTTAAKSELVREGYDPAFGARPLRRVVQRRIENELARRILAGEIGSGQCATVDFQDGAYSFKVRSLDAEIAPEAA